MPLPASSVFIIGVIVVVLCFQLRKLRRVYRADKVQAMQASPDRAAHADAGVRVVEAMGENRIFVAQEVSPSPFRKLGLIALLGVLVPFILWGKLGIDLWQGLTIGIPAGLVLGLLVATFHLVRRSPPRKLRIDFERVEIEFRNFTFNRALIGNPTPPSLIVPFADVVRVSVSEKYHVKRCEIITRQGRVAFVHTLKPFEETVRLLRDIEELNRSTSAYREVAAETSRRMTLVEIVLAGVIILGAAAWVYFTTLRHWDFFGG